MSDRAREPGRAEDRERELKLGIPDETSFRALLQAAGGRRGEPALQVNHFFDTESRVLRDRQIGFRIREERGRYTLTIKGPAIASETAALADRVEVERGLDPELAREALAGDIRTHSLLDRLADAEGGERDREGQRERGGDGPELVRQVRGACGAQPLQLIGSFRNERIRVECELAGQPVELEFDRTAFSADELRFEVELELAPGDSAEQVGAALEALFRGAGVTPAPTTSKLEHFLRRLEPDA